MIENQYNDNELPEPGPGTPPLVKLANALSGKYPPAIAGRLIAQALYEIYCEEQERQKHLNQIVINKENASKYFTQAMETALKKLKEKIEENNIEPPKLEKKKTPSLG